MRWRIAGLACALVFACTTSGAQASASACMAQAVDAAPDATLPADQHWVATWATAPQPAFPGPLDRYDARTVRLVVHATLGGPRARITLSNAYGDRPLAIADAHLARRATGADVVAGSDVALTFAGRRNAVVAPHASLTSDAADFAVPAGAELAISLRFAGPAAASTVHALALQTSYVASTPADAAATAHWSRARPIDSWPFLAGVDVAAPRAAFAVVALGDSLVDGDGSTPDAYRRWTDLLAARLQRDGAAVAVVNEGLIGNRLLHDSPDAHGSPFGRGFGEAVVARFDRDATPAGARVLILRAGANDIGMIGGVAPETERATPDQLVAAYRALIARAHARGLRVVGVTLTPFEHAKIPGYSTPDHEALREQVNAWLRSTHEIDALIDADALLRDPSHPSQLLPRLDHGDHMHPNDEGNAVLADAIDEGLLCVGAALATR